MRRNCATSSFILLNILILLVVVENARAFNHGINDELHFIHREIGLLRDENLLQNQEIDMLKEMMGLQNHQTISKQMTEELLDFKTMREDTSQRKRPARLLPLQLLFRLQNDTDYIPVRRFYGPPNNCSELSELGYTLNGFYFVKAHHQTGNNGRPTTKNGDKIQVEVVYCTFKHPLGIYNRSNVIEKKASVSYLNRTPTNETNSGIHFRARLTSNLEATKSTNILFDTVRFESWRWFLQ